MKKYLAKPRTERSREIPVGVFSSCKENALPLEKGGRDHNNVNVVLTNNERAMFIHLIEKRMEIYPDAMDIKRIVSIIGYTDRTIRWHIGKGRIFTIIQDRKYLVSKYSLIKFLASDKGFAMQPKSEWHEKAIRWFIKELYK